MQDNTDNSPKVEAKPIAIRFTRNLDLRIIDCTKPIPFEADRFIKDDEWSDEALSNCVALVPVTYINAGEYIKCLPLYIPIYSWGYGSSTIDITRTYKNEPVWFRLVGDITWAKISQSISSNYREQHRKETVNMPDKQKPQISTEHKVITYPEAFFYDVINQVRIDEESDEQHHNVEVIYNSFKDALEMDADSRISVTRNKMLALTYFQLFMMTMHYMNFFWKVRMAEENPGPENVTIVFHEVLICFSKHAYHGRNYPNDVSTWDELEIDLNSTKNEVRTLIDRINSYFYELEPEKENININVPPATPGMYQQIVMNKDGTPFRMPSDEDETDDDEPGENLNAKFREQECMQDMDLSRAHWAAEKIMLVVRTSMNICVLITLVFVVARMWALILSSEEKYKFTDVELGSIILTLIIITIITNIKTIFGWFKELSHG